MKASVMDFQDTRVAAARPKLGVRASWRFAFGVVLGLGGVLLITWVAFHLQLGLATVGFLQLLAVVFLALEFGFWTATVCSLVAVACLDYFFIPPIFTFNVTDPQDWISLIVFESCALIVSRLSNQARAEAVHAAMQKQNMERLYAASRQVLLLDRRRSIGPQIVTLIRARPYILCRSILPDAANRCRS